MLVVPRGGGKSCSGYSFLYNILEVDLHSSKERSSVRELSIYLQGCRQSRDCASPNMDRSE
jgi:hypothetical protein